MKLMIAGGGTGGHLFPGVAVARRWLERAPQGEVFFVGTARGLESKVVPAAGFRLLLIDQVGLKNRGIKGLLRALWLLPRSFAQSLAIVRRERPAVALGVGGYAAGPAMLAAWLLRVPSLILEPNAMPGLTNRILGAVVRRVVSPYDRARDHFPARKLLKAGIPVRAELAQALAGVRAEATRSLLVFGGSQGARAINEAAMVAVPQLVREGVKVLHQTGPADFARVSAAYAGLAVDVREFITDMAAAYAGCDLVVCRSGASTLAELGIVGRASILVPLPTAADDHQTKNAQAFVEAGAAMLLPQKDLTPESFSRDVRALMNDEPRRARMAAAAKHEGDPDAADKLCGVCLELAS
jgi:UDP-N-acetylglucosamine--N-acetylmuramyl-(pentapeptide) pyrophosphoryl-undecaprenol N-acetylglucosamine transferase